MHPHELLLFEVAQFRGPRDSRLFAHLRGCTECGERLVSLLRAGRLQPLMAVGYDCLPSLASNRASRREPDCRARDHCARRVAIFRERAEAPALVAALGGHPPARQRVILANHSRYQTWGVLELLVEQAGAAAFAGNTAYDTAGGARTPGSVEAAPLAAMALELAAHLDRDRYGAEMIADLCARARALTGHALQASGDLDGAEAAFVAAHVELRRGTGDALERAFVLGHKAALRAARGALADAERLLARATRIFSTLGDLRRAGRSLVALAEVRGRAGRPAAAIEALYRALELIGPEEDLELLLAAWQSLLSHLAACGRFDEVRGLRARSRELARRCPQARAALAYLWQEAGAGWPSSTSAKTSAASSE